MIIGVDYKQDIHEFARYTNNKSYIRHNVPLSRKLGSLATLWSLRCHILQALLFHIKSTNTLILKLYFYTKSIRTLTRFSLSWSSSA